jgi:hypothetical protein
MKNNMSGKTAKAERKEQEAKQAESKSRQEAFMKEVEALSLKYKVDLVAALAYKNTAIVPQIVLVDVKDKYEHMTEEAKKAEEAKKEEKVKPQAQNGVLEKPTVPHLET